MHFMNGDGVIRRVVRVLVRVLILGNSIQKLLSYA